MREQLKAEIATCNAVADELKAGLDHEQTRSKRFKSMLAEARKPWWQRWLG